jgi:hypothetical protein
MSVEDENDLTAFLRIIIEPFQDLQDAFQQLRLERWLTTAVGEQLNVIGRIVKQPRAGLDDDTYRRYLFAKVIANKSCGLIEDLIAVTKLIVNDPVARIVADNQGAACIVIRVEEVAIPHALADVIINFLRIPTVGGGVRVILESCHEPPADWFVRDVDNHDQKFKITARDRALGVA